MKILLLLSLFLNLALSAALILRDSRSIPELEKPLTTESRVPQLNPPEKRSPLPQSQSGSLKPMAVPASLDGLSHAEQVAALVEGGWEADDAKVFLLGRALREQARWHLANPPVANPDVYWRRRQDLPLDEERQRGAKERAQQVEEAMDAFFDKHHRRSPYGLVPQLPFSEEKRNALIAWEQDYQKMSQQIRADAFGFLLPEDLEALALLEREKEKDLEAILSPEELFEYRLRVSDTAVSLRRELDVIDPTEEEFRTVFQLRYEVDRLRANDRVGNGDEETIRIYREANEALKDRLREVLGEDRYRRYERSQDWSYSRLTALTKRLQLPLERVDEVFDIRDYAKAREAALQASALSPEEQQAALQALRDEVHADIQDLLGSKGAELYEKEAGGHWLRHLE